MSAPDFYMNVWRSAYSDHQWTDVGCTHDETNTREFADRVAASVASRPDTAIRRLGLLRVTLKRQQADCTDTTPVEWIEMATDIVRRVG